MDMMGGVPGIADKFFSMDDDEQRRVALVGLLVLGMRLALWVVPYRILRRMVEVRPRRGVSRPPSQPPAWIARYIVSTSRLVPQATCLTQALVAQFLLRREGLQPTLQLGVARDGGVFKAHAWVECNGQFIVGDFARSPVPYTTLKAAEGPPAEMAASPTGHTWPAGAADGLRNT